MHEGTHIAAVKCFECTAQNSPRTYLPMFVIDFFPGTGSAHVMFTEERHSLLGESHQSANDLAAIRRTKDEMWTTVNVERRVLTLLPLGEERIEPVMHDCMWEQHDAATRLTMRRGVAKSGDL